MISKIRDDIEGVLVRIGAGDGACFAKHLPTDTAWHIFDPIELVDADDGVVSTTSTTSGKHEIRYAEGVEPLDLDALRKLIDDKSPLVEWRLCKLMLDLLHHLKLLQGAQIPQMVLHPERIGRLSDRFVLLPTMAGLLPTIASLPLNAAGGWLHYAAPEVVRTRARSDEISGSAELYSLGRLIQVLSEPSWEPAVADHSLALAVVRAETPDVDCIVASDSDFRGVLADLALRLSTTNPARRPELDAARAVVQSRFEELDPVRQFEAEVKAGEYSAAQRILSAMRMSHETGLFGNLTRSMDIATADLLMLSDPPEYLQARALLDQAEGTHYAADTQLRIARTHVVDTASQDRSEEAAECYQRSASRSGFDTEIVDEWIAHLEGFASPEKLLSDTDDVPHESRPRRLVCARASAELRQGLIVRAWVEVVVGFKYLIYDDELYQLGLAIGQHFQAPHHLLDYLHDDDLASAAPRAIAHGLIGDFERATEYRDAAVQHVRRGEG